MNVHSLRCLVGAEVGCASAGCDLRDLRLEDCLRILTFIHSVIQIYSGTVYTLGVRWHTVCLSPEFVYHYLYCLQIKISFNQILWYKNSGITVL